MTGVQTCALPIFLFLDDLARDQVYEFMLVVAPLRIDRGLGSPINPIALT